MHTANALSECERADRYLSRRLMWFRSRAGKPFIFTAEVAVKPEVTLGEYKGVEVEKAPVEVTDAEIEAEVDKQREQNCKNRTDIDDRAVEKGRHRSQLDFDGFC